MSPAATRSPLRRAAMGLVEIGCIATFLAFIVLLAALGSGA